MEFALAWPIVLLLVLGAVQIALWVSEAAAVREAARAGARAGTVAGASADLAARVTVTAMSAALVGSDVAVWCPGQRAPQPRLWVCAKDIGSALQVDVGGSVSAVVPIVRGGGIPIRAHVVLDKEGFRR